MANLTGNLFIKEVFLADTLLFEDVVITDFLQFLKNLSPTISLMGKVAAVITDFESARNDQQMINTLQFGVRDSLMEYYLFHL
jgi:hypothetical protein